MSAPLLQTSDLSAAYGGVLALHGIDLTVRASEAVAIVGANGAGKSTFLATLAGLMAPVAGTVLLDGQEVTRTPAERMVRAGVVLVPEGREVFSTLSVRDNLLLGAYSRGRDSGLARDLEEVFALFPSLRDRAGQRAGLLSGGEQQMLAIGRGLMSQPRLLLLDEPSLGLAPLAIREVIERLLVLKQRGLTLLIVEQNTRLAERVADRVLVFERGHVVASGGREVLLDPALEGTYLGQKSTLGGATGSVSVSPPAIGIGAHDEAAVLHHSRRR